MTTDQSADRGRPGLQRFAAERRRQILDRVRRNGAMSLRELAAGVNVSEATVRRDLQRLESEGLLDRQHGGATTRGLLSHELTFMEKTGRETAEKIAIAELAVAMVEPGDTIAITPGTTTHEFAERLAGVPGLTVVTNSLRAVGPFARAGVSEVIVTGGILRHSIFALVGAQVEHVLRGMEVRRIFMSGNGLSVRRGLSTPNMQVAEADRAFAALDAEIVVLVDHTKIGVEAMVQTVPVDRMTHLCVDNGVDPVDLAAFRDLGVQVHVAEVP